MRLYNLFPLLAGPVGQWQPHLERAADLGFNWVFINPIQKLGQSGSLYSIADYFQINPALLSPRSRKTPEQQVRAMVAQAEKLGLKLMIDLVINHCAADSPLIKKHPEWFCHEDDGSVSHPFCMEDGHKVVWYDLARFDHHHSADQEGLYQFFLEILDYLIGLGFHGFRCDAAYQIPGQIWARLIHDIRKRHPDIVFSAETLGCSADETKETATAGFDYIFNSSKWWDLGSPWLIEQYHLLHNSVDSISFPESHDTPRLFEETNGNVDAQKQRYLFSALFSAGVMMPMGYEFGFRKPLHVVHTTPKDWEQPAVDLSDFIRSVNAIKARYQVFQKDYPTDIIGYDNPAIMVMWKGATDGAEEALFILNKDIHNRQHFYVNSLDHYVQAGAPLTDVSPEWPMEYLPKPFEYELPPGVGRVLVTRRNHRGIETGKTAASPGAKTVATAK